MLDGINVATTTYEMMVTQRDCALLINEICDNKTVNRIAKPRPRSDDSVQQNIFEAIRKSFKYDNPTFDQNKYIIYMCQILKFTGDKSHQTIAELLNMVFKSRPAFKQMIGCVNTIDRPLIVGCIMDNRPFIVPETSAQMMRSMGLPYTSETLKTQKKKLVAFYIPKMELDIFGRLGQNFTSILKYRSMLLQLYDPQNTDFYSQLLGKRERKAKEIVKTIYNTMTYISLFYLSFFSFEIINLNFITKNDAARTIVPLGNLPGEGVYYNRTVGKRIHGAAIAYILYNDDTLTLNESGTHIDRIKLAGFDFMNLTGMPTPAYPAFDIKISPMLKDLTSSFLAFPYRLDNGPLRAQFKNIMQSYLIIKSNRFDYTENLEEIFMRELKMPEFMGGMEVDPPPPLAPPSPPLPPAMYIQTQMIDPNTIDTYYEKNYPIVDFKEPSSDLINLCESYKNQDKIIESVGGVNRDVHALLFGNPSAPITDRPLDPNRYYDNLFMYNQHHKGDQLLVNVTTYIPLVNGLCNDLYASAGPFDPKGYLTFNCFQIQDFCGTYYMFPSYTIKIEKKNGGIFQEKQLGIIMDKNVIEYSKGETNESLNYELIFKRFTEYINDVSFLMELDYSIVQDIRDKMKNICFGVQCKLAVFFALLFFKHTSTVLQIKKLSALFGQSLFVKPPETPVETTRRIAEGTSNGGRGSDRTHYDKSTVLITAAIPDNTVVNVLGIFSILPEGSNAPTRYDITKLDGRYFIFKKHLQESYIELKKALVNFLEKCHDIFQADNEYSGINLL